MAAALTTQTQPEPASNKHKHASGSSNASVASHPAVADATTNGVSDGFEHTYLRELQKSLRNTLKKLNATSKVDAIIAENPGKSLDELVAEKKINADQKAQALKKPALQATVAQLEEQVGHYKQLATHYEERLVSQKAALEKAHKEEVEALREKARAEASESSAQDLKGQLLALSKFLCAAANMRRSGDATSNESRAFESVLFQVYGGTTEAVGNMLKLIEGVDEKIVTLEGETLEITYGAIKKASEVFPEGTVTQETVATEAAPASDPTVANAGLTELQDPTLAAEAAGANGVEEVPPPAQTLVSDAANPVAESSWEPSASGSANADGWIEVPRNPSETDTGLQATPASVDTGLKNTLTTEASGTSAIPEPSTAREQRGAGFEQVHHQRQHSGRSRGGRGEFRGRGRGGRGEFRGRGRGRGEFRGNRGRGGFGGQNGNGAPAAAAANEPQW